MRIIEVIPSLKYRAGAEVFSVDLSCSLKKSGNEVLFVCLYDDIDISFENQFSSYSVNVVFCGKKKGIDLRCSRRFKELVKTFKPDIIHAHLGCLITYFFAFGFKKNNWQFVQTIHNIADFECDKFNKIIKKLYLQHRLLSLVGISKEISKSIFETYKRKPYTIYNGIKLKKIPATCPNPLYDIVCVARFSEQKNHKLLIDAVYKLVYDYKYSNLKCVCVGSGPLFNKIIDYANELQLNNNIKFPGNTDNVFSYLESSKIFVLSSLYEGNPVSVLEAMNAGLPVVVPNVGGIPDVVINKTNGIIYETNNLDDLVISLKTMLDDESLRNQISATNRKQIMTYSIETCANEYFSIFLEMCGASK